MAGPDFRVFLVYLTALLALGFGLRQLERVKRLKGEERDNE